MRSELPAGPVARVGLLSLIALAFIPMSCGSDGPEMASVSGSVTYQGKPVPMGTVTFVAKDANHRNAIGYIDANGRYKLQTEVPGDGAQVGEYDVTVYSHDEKILDYKPKVPIPPKILTPEKYENPRTSGLKGTVQRGSNTVNLDLID